MTEQLILQQLSRMPESLKKEVLDFATFLLSKQEAKPKEKKVPVFGSAKGKYQLAEDFDAPLDDFKDYME